MASLWNQLNAVLHNVLPTDPSKAINGTQLLAKVRSYVQGEYADGSLRQHFSDMSKDPTTVIAKVSEGHGYYLRGSQSAHISSLSIETDQELQPIPIGARGLQPEEKFRSIVMRYAELENQEFPILIDHTKAVKKESGINQWKFPDLVLLRWEVGRLTDQGFYKLDQDLLAVRTSLGEPPFKLHSVELKVALTAGSFRENFFQCVSNSKWAHQAVLAVATTVEDKTLRDELARLGNSYDVLIVSYGLTEQLLGTLPSASTIRSMTDSEFEEQISSKISLSTYGSVRERAALDWEHIGDLRGLSRDMADLFEWTAYCLTKKRAYSFLDFDNIRKIERHN